MGSVLTPSYVGIENALDLPQAATMCGECHVVCPMKIPLPDLLRKLREKQMERGLRPWRERAGLRVWSWAARHPGVYRPLTRMASRMLRWMGGDAQRIRSLPLGAGWSDYRDMPAPTGSTFKERWAKRQR
jgi:L-lactate dehydrogenase complex protein LldF